MSQQLEINIKAVDNASRTVVEASKTVTSSMKEVEEANKRVAAAQKETVRSSRDLVTGLSGVATSAFSLYNAYDQVKNSQISLGNANLQLKSSLAAVENAQKRLTNALDKYGAGSEQASTAARDLQLAQERCTIAADQAEQAQNNVSKAMAQTALQIIPASITMVDSLSRAWKNFPDMSGMLKNLSSNIANVGSTAKTAALGVGAFVGGFMLADSILGVIPEDLRAIAGALTASIAAIVAATVAWMAFHGTMTVGVAVPIILGAVGAGIAGIKAAVAMAEGGIVREPTFALIGEAGPEVVAPLDRFERMMGGGGPQYVEVYAPISIGSISGEVDLDRARAVVSEGIAEGVRRRLP